jgi:arylsulfatase A-like enzyme
VELLQTDELPPFKSSVCAEFAELKKIYWDQPPEWKLAFAAWMSEYYRAEIAGWDATFGALLDELDTMGALDDTLVVFATDHGEQLGERNAFGHGMLLGPEETRATAAFWAKSLTPASWSGVTVHADIAATLFDLYGLAPSTPLEGVVAGTAPDTRAVPIWNVGSGLGAGDYAEHWNGTAGLYLSVVRGDLQLNYDWDGNRAFYRLDTDPAGVIDVYDGRDTDVIALWETMGALVTELAGYFPEMSDPVAPTP